MNRFSFKLINASLVLVSLKLKLTLLFLRLLNSSHFESESGISLILKMRRYNRTTCVNWFTRWCQIKFTPTHFNLDEIPHNMQFWFSTASPQIPGYVTGVVYSLFRSNKRETTHNGIVAGAPSPLLVSYLYWTFQPAHKLKMTQLHNVALLSELIGKYKYITFTDLYLNRSWNEREPYAPWKLYSLGEVLL